MDYDKLPTMYYGNVPMSGYNPDTDVPLDTMSGWKVGLIGIGLGALLGMGAFSAYQKYRVAKVKQKLLSGDPAEREWAKETLKTVRMFGRDYVD